MIGLLPGLVDMDGLDEKHFFLLIVIVVMLRSSSLLWGLLSLHVLNKYVEQMISGRSVGSILF